MNRSIILAACTCVLLNCAQVFGTSWDTVVFRDDFDSSVGGMPDPNTWVVNHPGSWWWVQGRTHFPNQGVWGSATSPCSGLRAWSGSSRRKSPFADDARSASPIEISSGGQKGS